MHIKMVCPNRDDATSFYRGWGYFSEIRRQMEYVPHNPNPGGGWLHFSDGREVSWSMLADVDLLFIQRPFLPQSLQLINIANCAGVPVWVDWDDMLWQIPVENPAHDFYRRHGDCATTIMKCAEMADIVTVSTQSFKEMFPEPIQSKIIVRQNFLPARYRRRPRRFRHKGIPVIAWRGTRTHDGDWYEYLDAAVEFSKKHSVKWLMVGKPAFWVVDALAKVSVDVKVLGEMPLDTYFDYILSPGKESVANIMFVPLRDCNFNRAKSNIAMIEAAYGGMIPVTPNWPGWSEVPSWLQYDHPATALSALENAIGLLEQNSELHCQGIIDSIIDEVESRRDDKWREILAEFSRRKIT